MTSFVLVAVLLTLLAVCLLVWPLALRRSSAPGSWKLAGGAGALLVAGVASLYPVWSEWNWNETEVADGTPAAMVGRLARRLERNPEDLEGWLMLGKSYSVIEQYPLAARAYQRADRLAGGKNTEALTGLAEALVLSNQGGLDGRAGRLFEQALALDPNLTKALFYSAIAALERREFPLARERFVRLLEGNPPPEVRRIIEEQVRALDSPGAALASVTPPNAGGPAQATPGAGNSGSAATAATPVAAAQAVVEVPLRITLSGAVAAQAKAGAPLFVLARVPGQRGPPLAARRLDPRFPQDVELRSSDAMIAGTGFVAGQELEIEARVANGGSAISQPGDPFGTVKVRAGEKKRISIEINQVKP